MNPRERLIVGIDVTSTNVRQTTFLIDSLMPHVGSFKLGLSSIYSMLASLIDPNLDIQRIGNQVHDIRAMLRLLHGNILLDIKLDDIPDEISKICQAIRQLDAKMFTIHASAGKASLEEAVANRGNSLPLGASVLTSMDSEECVLIFGDEPGPKVLQFAHMLSDVGASGIVCSGQEAELIRQHPELSHFFVMTPGVYPKWMPVSDQKRVMTPAQAIKAGATHVIMRRSIIDSPQKIGGPVEAAKRVLEEIAGAS